MNTIELHRLIAENAEHVRRLHARIHETVKFRDKSVMKREEWQRACAEFHARYDMLAFPGGYANALERIMQGDAIRSKLRYASLNAGHISFDRAICSRPSCRNLSAPH